MRNLCFLTPDQQNPDGPLFVFLPGMDGTGRLLRSQTSGLKAAFDIRCLAIPAEDLTDWDVLADRVIALVNRELENRRHKSVYLCGESFGGCLALKVALRSPQLFNRIILANPASSFNQQLGLSWGSYLTAYIPEFIYRMSSVGFLPFLAALGRIQSSDRRALLEAMQSVPPKTLLWRVSLLRNFNIDATQLSSLSQPVLVIASAGDRLLPSVTEAERLVKSLPNAQIVVLPDSGHACLLETDINLYKIIQLQNFLDKPSETSGKVMVPINGF